jgi:hypothetical protein
MQIFQAASTRKMLGECDAMIRSRAPKIYQQVSCVCLGRNLCARCRMRTRLVMILNINFCVNACRIVSMSVYTYMLIHIQYLDTYFSIFSRCSSIS